MTIAVAGGRGRVAMLTSRIGNTTQAITLPSSGVLAFAGSATIPATPQASPFVQFPSPWTPVSDHAGIRLIIHNFSLATPIRATLLNADGTVFYADPIGLLVEPGAGPTSLGIINVTVPGLPTSALKFALQNLVVGDSAGFNVEVQAWAV